MYPIYNWFSTELTDEDAYLWSLWQCCNNNGMQVSQKQWQHCENLWKLCLFSNRSVNSFLEPYVDQGNRWCPGKRPQDLIFNTCAQEHGGTLVCICYFSETLPFTFATWEDSGQGLESGLIVETWWLFHTSNLLSGEYMFNPACVALQYPSLY